MPVTHLAVVPVVTRSHHMPIRSTFSTEYLRTCLAFKFRGPVTCRVHMLIAGSERTKKPGTGLAFGPVSIEVHVVVQILYVRVPLRAGWASEAEHVG